MLNKLALKYNTDKKMYDGIAARNGVQGHSYVQYYESIIPKDISTLLEIGVSFGSSIKMWAEYLPQTQITGIDISTQRFNKRELEAIPNVKIIVGDATNKKVISTLGKFDVIIDDGSHKDEDIIKSLILLYPHLNKGGIYVIEDLHVSSRSNPFSAINILRGSEGVELYENETIAFIHK